MTSTGRVLWRYGPPSGAGALDHPSLATRIAPGLIAITDEFRHRVVVVSVKTHRIVWQYGHTDVAGSGPGFLHTPDGLDLLPATTVTKRADLRSLISRAERAYAHRSPAG